MSTALSPTERLKLGDLELVIERGLQAFVEVGVAISMIREQRLYRESHETFEAYCRERWGWSASRARQLIGATEVVQHLETVTPGNTPPTERHARPLASLDEAERAEAWQEAVETAPKADDGTPKVTAAHVRETVEKRVGRDPRPMAPKTTITPEEYRAHPRKPAEAVQPRQYSAKMRSFIRASLDLGEPDDEDIEAIPVNDIMLDGLCVARATLDRIISNHRSAA